MLDIESVSVDIYSAGGIIFVMVLHQVPFVYLTIRGPIMGMDPSYEEAARTAGASPWRMLAPRHAADAVLRARLQRACCAWS